MKALVASEGMALAQAYVLAEPQIVVVQQTVQNVDAELARFYAALETSAQQIEALIARLGSELEEETASILDFQLLMLEDTDFIQKVEQVIRQNFNCEYAVQTASGQYIQYLQGLRDNNYLRERAGDISDLAQRILCVLTGVQPPTQPDCDYIAVGVDIPPSVVAELDKRRLKGIILEKGGKTSHCVILSRSLGKPCLIQATGIMAAVQTGQPLLLDAVAGEVVLQPNTAQTVAYNAYMAKQQHEQTLLEAYKIRPSITQDGREVKVFANITTCDEAAELLRQGGEGVGLFRTELLYMTQTAAPPPEELQYSVYSQTASMLAGRPLIIRTLDVGGDKGIPYLHIPQEENPFLGYRAIRYCLGHPEVFKAQLRAILQAGENVQIMFPMITGKQEITRAKQLLEEARQELVAQNKAFYGDIPVGIMIETPAAAFDAQRLADEVDFFSIGTNDLTQYLFAADRTNPKLSGLNSPFHPTLLRCIARVVAAGHAAGIAVDICGQAAEIPALVPLWVAMGVDALSVSIPSITKVRKIICEANHHDCSVLLKKALQLDTPEEVEKLLAQQIM